jgi:hypothetical protein
MTLLHPLIELPISNGPRLVENAYDPYAAKFGADTWIAFECSGPHIAGASACVAPLVGNADHIDVGRLSIPVMGVDGVPSSPWTYSASTPKLLTFQDRLYLYWTAIRINKAPPHRWNDIETRGAEMAVETTGLRRMWVKGHPDRPLPSHASGASSAVMVPRRDDPYRNTSVDTEGLFVNGEHIIALSSVGGAGPNGGASCTKPLDLSQGCFRLEITRTSVPLGNDAFHEQELVSPTLPANPVEYPRIVIGPSGQTYLMAVFHPVRVSAAPSSGRELPEGYMLLPLHLPSLHFSRDRKR